MKVLFVFANIDDAEIYCGGTMLKLKFWCWRKYDYK